MKQNKEAESPKSRRNFLNNGLIAGASIATGLLAGKLVKGEEGSDRVKMITADGKLVEVDRKVLPMSNSKPVSNQELKEWMNQRERK